MEEEEQLKEYKRKINSLQQVVARLQEKNRSLQDQNQELKTALKDKIMDERLEILKISRQNLRTYFSIRANDYKDRLTALEDEVQEKLDRLKKKAEVKLADDQDQIKEKISALETELQEQINQNQQEFRAQKDEITEEYQMGAEKLAERKIEERNIEYRKQHHQLEEELGINLLNKLGIGLILLGLGFIYRYFMINWFNSFWEGIGFFLLGGLLFAGGEWFYRRDQLIGQQSLTASGVIAVYCGIFYSYFLLNLIGLKLGVGLIVLITVGTFMLAIHYLFEPLAMIGTVGTYLGLYIYIASGGLQGTALYWGLVYLAVVTSLILAEAWYQKWKLLVYVNFILHLPWLIYLVKAGANWESIIYVAGMGGVYLLVMAVYHIYYQLKIKLPDLILISANLVINTVVLGLLVSNWGSTYLGILALSLSIVYLGINWLGQLFLPQEQKLSLLVQGAAFILAAGAVPLLWTTNWWMVGWLAEAVGLILVGYYYQSKLMELAGGIIFAISVVAFYSIDCRLQFLGAGANKFIIKYLIFDGGLISGLVFYWHRLNQQEELTSYNWQIRAINYYKYFTIINVWISLLYFIFKVSGQVVPDNYARVYKLILLILLHLGGSYLLLNTQWLQDKVVKGFVVFLALTAACLVQYLNWSQSLVADSGGSLPSYFVLLWLVVCNGLIMFVLYKLGLKLLDYWRYGLQVQLLGLGIWLIIVITSSWTVQLQLELTTAAFSFLYLGLAVVFLGYGFYRQVSYLRILGLGLFLLGLGKLLLIDLAGLGLVSKIFIYLGSGGLLVAVSLNYGQLKRAAKDYLENLSL